MEVKLTSKSTKADVEACLGWTIRRAGSNGFLYGDCVFAPSLGPLRACDSARVYGSESSYLTLEFSGGVEFALFEEEWITLAPPALPKGETLLERKARLEKELSETEAEIAREGLPDEGYSWGEDRDGVTVSGPCGLAFNSRVIAWGSGRRNVYLKPNEHATLPAAAIFAWVDRVRELGETDL